MLIKAGANIESKTSVKKNMIDVIFFCFCVFIFVDLCFFHQDGWTPLMMAACYGFDDIVLELITAGANIEEVDVVE